ncbi:hypothetical protein MK805_00210 [Shimazuella sp. AN120528]|uniref:hypothetical protein n=1 Tax=Shimazuella soli TaxID=1892854 RepID=UPI001F0DA9B9|nr:hypothetical protein [Shimazuella soli]MCH5583404.1 hypothetical protein [Shimazuella soli]
MNRPLLESNQTASLPAVPYITMENDLMYKLENAFTKEKPLLILFQTPFGDHQFSGYITEISFHDKWIGIENGVLAKRIFMDQILLVVEWS